MRPLPLLALAVVLSGCQPEMAGGFRLYPHVAGCPALSCSPELGFASDGTLWVVFENTAGWDWQAQPAHFAGGRWELGTLLDAIDESNVRLLGMHDDSPVVFTDGPLIPEGPSNALCPGSYFAVVSYSQGTWTRKPICQDRAALAPDGRLYLLWTEQYHSGDLLISVLSPTWDAEESRSLLLAAGGAVDPRQGVLAFSPSSEPVFEHLADNSPRTVLGFRKWDGTSWVPATPGLDVGAADLAGAVRDFKVDSQGRIWVTPGELPATTWRWSGTAWEDLGGLSDVLPSTEVPTRVATALDAEDRFVVAWTTQGEPSRVSMRRYGPGGWEDLGPAIEEPGRYIQSLGVTIAPDQTPIVAWVSFEKEPFLGIHNCETKVARYVGK